MKLESPTVGEIDERGKLFKQLNGTEFKQWPSKQTNDNWKRIVTELRKQQSLNMSQTVSNVSHTTSNRSAKTESLKKTMDGVYLLSRSIKETFNTKSDGKFVLQPAFPEALQIDQNQETPKSFIDHCKRVISTIKMACTQNSRHSSDKEVKQQLFGKQAKNEPVRIMKQLGQVSKERTQQLVNFQKESMLHQAIYLAILILCLVGVYRLVTLNIAATSLIIGATLIASLGFAVSETRHQYGLSTGDIVNVALIFAVSHKHQFYSSFLFFWHEGMSQMKSFRLSNEYWLPCRVFQHQSSIT